jgi:outer membrane protein OmpA-like peptidoglycan-associated protein
MLLALGLLTACASAPEAREPEVVEMVRETYQTEALRGRQEQLLAAGQVPVAPGNVGLYMSAVARELKAAVGDTAEVQEDEDMVLLRLSSELAFEVGSAELSADSASHMETGARVLASYSLSLLEISGHTDSTGSAAINQRLSGQRARSVADVLKAQGVDPARMVVEGRSDTQALADNASDEGRRKNRRVEIRVVPLLAAETVSRGEGSH